MRRTPHSHVHNISTDLVRASAGQLAGATLPLRMPDSSHVTDLGLLAHSADFSRLLAPGSVSPSGRARTYEARKVHVVRTERTCVRPLRARCEAAARIFR